MSTAWILVVVGLHGDISNSTYPNEAACRDALSVAQTGLTVAENADAEKTAVAKKQRWYAEHPPHAATTTGERAVVKAAKLGINFEASKFHTSYHVTQDGLVQDDPPIVAAPISMVKSAKCISGGD